MMLYKRKHQKRKEAESQFQGDVEGEAVQVKNRFASCLVQAAVSNGTGSSSPDCVSGIFGGRNGYPREWRLVMGDAQFR